MYWRIWSLNRYMFKLNTTAQIYLIGLKFVVYGNVGFAIAYELHFAKLVYSD
jgi:hypothetical protein